MIWLLKKAWKSPQTRHSSVSSMFTRKHSLKDPRGSITPRRLRYWRSRGYPIPTHPEPLACECCGQPENRTTKSGKPRHLHLDHDHETGVFRGWLCTRCNMAIGLLGDSKPGVKQAIKYLNRAGAHNRRNDRRKSLKIKRIESGELLPRSVHL